MKLDPQALTRPLYRGNSTAAFASRPWYAIVPVEAASGAAGARPNGSAPTDWAAISSAIMARVKITLPRVGSQPRQWKRNSGCGILSLKLISRCFIMDFLLANVDG